MGYITLDEDMELIDEGRTERKMRRQVPNGKTRAQHYKDIANKVKPRVMIYDPDNPDSEDTKEINKDPEDKAYFSDPNHGGGYSKKSNVIVVNKLGNTDAEVANAMNHEFTHKGQSDTAEHIHGTNTVNQYTRNYRKLNTISKKLMAKDEDTIKKLNLTKDEVRTNNNIGAKSAFKIYEDMPNEIHAREGGKKGYTNSKVVKQGPKVVKQMAAPDYANKYLKEKREELLAANAKKKIDANAEIRNTNKEMMDDYNKEMAEYKHMIFRDEYDREACKPIKPRINSRSFKLTPEEQKSFLNQHIKQNKKPESHGIKQFINSPQFNGRHKKYIKEEYITLDEAMDMVDEQSYGRIIKAAGSKYLDKLGLQATGAGLMGLGGGQALVTLASASHNPDGAATQILPMSLMAGAALVHGGKQMYDVGDKESSEVSDKAISILKSKAKRDLRHLKTRVSDKVSDVVNNIKGRFSSPSPQLVRA